VAWLLLELHQSDSDVPEEFVRQVGRTLVAEHDFLARAIPRGVPLVPMMRRELEQKKMPHLLHYVAAIESGYRSEARSAAGALGLWQFMPGTAGDYGLAVGSGVDERTDPEKSTRAAAHYLQHLVFEFGSDALLLALAGYNYGQARVRVALKKLEDPFHDRSYWRLVERGLLPAETAAYVARYTAAALAGESGLPDDATLRAAGY
jgi:membrane-bound lytic murein transglycosylase D